MPVDCSMNDTDKDFLVNHGSKKIVLKDPFANRFKKGYSGRKIPAK